MMTPRFVPQDLRSLICECASQWDVDPEMLEAEVLSTADPEEVDIQFELLLSIQRRSQDIELEWGVKNAARDIWAQFKPTHHSIALKYILCGPLTIVLLEEADSALWELEEFFGLIGRPDEPVDGPLFEFLTRVLGPPKNLSPHD